MLYRLLISAMLIAAMTTSVFAQSNKTTKLISLEFEQVPILTALNMIATQNGLNLVAGGSVDGTVSIQLTEVDIWTALDAILAANGYTYFVRDDVIIVKAIKDTEATDLISKLFTLNYLDPITAKKALEGRLSEKGKVIILDKKSDSESNNNAKYSPNRIIITDLPSNIASLSETITLLDVRERSILIEAKIIETELDDDLRLGFNWPSAVTVNGTGASDGSVTSGTTLQSNNSLGAFNLGSGRWNWGKLSIAQMSLVLDMLEQKGNSHLVSDPRITTIENHEAEFRYEIVIPIQTINRFTEGSSTSDIVTFQDEEVGISLLVTPRINGDGNITMELFPTVEDIIGYSGTPENRKPITSSRSIRTRITVKDGETVALGGLLKENEIESIKRVPFLGHIPLLGKLLFTNKSIERTKTDLIILITPHILD